MRACVCVLSGVKWSGESGIDGGVEERVVSSHCYSAPPTT